MIRTDPVLLIRSRSVVGALPLASVVETLRPPAIESLRGVPSFVLGVSIIRGAPVPVVDLGSVLGAQGERRSSRLVTLRSGSRVVAVAVEEVMGVRPIPSSDLQVLPPLLGDSSAPAVESMAALDGDLLLLLRAARLVPEDVWTRIAPAEAAS